MWLCDWLRHRRDLKRSNILVWIIIKSNVYEISEKHIFHFLRWILVWCVGLECLCLSTCVYRDLLARKCHLIHVMDLVCPDQKTTFKSGNKQLQSVCKEMLGTGVNYVKYLCQEQKVFSFECCTTIFVKTEIKITCLLTLLFFFPWRNRPQWATASSLSRFYD